MGIFFENDYDDMYDYFPGDYVYGSDRYTSDEHMHEKWWYIDGYPNYMISNHGRVWSSKTRRFLKPRPANEYGHLSVSLCANGHIDYMLIHRLVAKAFIPNPNKRPIIRHLDDDPSNNYAYNLAWGTQKENFADCIANGKANCLSLETPIVAINTDTGRRHIYRSQSKAARDLGVNSANIWKVLHGERPHTRGWRFEYANKEDELND